jgi:nucleotide-binding universal stress UspA family protein
MRSRRRFRQRDFRMKRIGPTTARQSKDICGSPSQARDTHREAVRTWLMWLETEAVPANQAMLAAQEAAEQAGLRVEQLHIPHLLPEAVAHRCRIGRQGLG